MSEIFAKLETVNGLQTLAELANTDDGPKIRLRRDDGVTCEITMGPWPDTEEGWQKAETALSKLDMTFATKQLDGVISQLKAQSN